jgi:hypothetical protein
MREGEIGWADDADAAGRFSFGRDARELLGLDGDDVLLIKASYWLNP